jgi:succinyl-CoA synthetase beta subunit
VLVYEKIDIEREFFISIDYDLKEMKPVITYSSKGGLGIRNIEARYANTVHKIFVDIKEGLDL